MRYLVSKSVVELIGVIWMPASVCGQRKELRQYDADNCRDDEGNVTRESVEQWLCSNAGDFQSVKDFHASLEVDGKTVEIPWKDEESECIYNDCMYPEEV